MKNKISVKLAVSSVAAIFLVILYVTIFFFSAQDGTESGTLSHRVTEVIVDQVETIAKKNWTEEVKVSLIRFWENPVRKMAHFSEYTCMGILVFGVWIPWVTAEKWRSEYFRWNGLVVLWVFLSAALDEWHQTMVSGRCGTIWDVLLDTSGGCFGVLVCLLFMALILRWKHKSSDDKADHLNTKIVDLKRRKKILKQKTRPEKEKTCNSGRTGEK